jgi:hypothetical protein
MLNGTGHFPGVDGAISSFLDSTTAIPDRGVFTFFILIKRHGISVTEPRAAEKLR